MLSTYLKEFRKLFISEHSQDINAPELYLDDWKTYILDVYEGYSFDISEFNLEYSALRGGIEHKIQSPILNQFPEHKIFIDKIHQLDEYFLKIAVFDPYSKRKNWWENRVLKYAKKGYMSDSLIDYMWKNYKVELHYFNDMEDVPELMEAKEKLKNFDVSFPYNSTQKID